MLECTMLECTMLECTMLEWTMLAFYRHHCHSVRMLSRNLSYLSIDHYGRGTLPTR